MAEEKSFRPQRKPIESQEDNQSKLNEMAKIRQLASEAPAGPPSQPFGLPPGLVTGQVPPAMQQMMHSVVDPNASAVPFENITSTNENFKNTLAKIKASKQLYEEITLPSLGKFYNGTDGPRSGKLHIRAMTGHEEEILATGRLVRKGQAMNMIFNKCIQENINAEDLLTEDRTYLLIYLRGISYTPKYDVEIVCPGCERKFSHVIDLSGLYVDSCPDDFSLTSLSGMLPMCELPFTYRLSRGADEQQIQDYRERKNKENGTDDTLLYRSALLLEDLGGIKDKKEILQILKELHISDVAHIRNTLSEPPFGVDTEIEIYCPGCLRDFTTDLPLESDFFFPRKRKRPEKILTQ